MASTYSPSLKLTLMGDGDQSGLWGQTTNTNLGTLVEQAVTGTVSITMSDANYTLTSFNGVSDEARNAVLVVTGTNNAVRDLIPPVAEKLYTVVNNTTGGFAIRVIGSSGTGVNIPNGATCLVYCDGTNFVNGLSGTSGNFSVAGALSVTSTANLGGALTGTTATFSGAITSASPTFTGTVTIPTPSPGSNTTVAASTAFVNAAVTTVSASLGTIASQNANNVTITGGTITGITDLTVADGGTGASTFTSNSVVLGNGTSSLAGNMVAPGTSGNVLTSNGTTWQSSAAPAAIGVGQSYTDFVSAGGRVLNDIYQNTTGKPIFVFVSGSSSTATAFVAASSPPTTVAAVAPAGGGAVFASMSFIVPNNFYYRVTGGFSTINSWSELR
jgi:hypothetical protein